MSLSVIMINIAKSKFSYELLNFLVIMLLN